MKNNKIFELWIYFLCIVVLILGFWNMILARENRITMQKIYEGGSK